MSSVRVRLSLLILLTIAVTGGLGHFAYEALEKYTHFIKQTELSFKSVSYAQSKINAKHSKKSAVKLKEFREALDGKNRQRAFSDFVQAYNAKSKSRMKRKLSFYRKNEVKYREYAESQFGFLRKRFTFFALLSALVAFFSLMIILLYTSRAVLKPIRDLNRKMIDFLNHKYTYQFVVPSHNEIGSLQGTFNSLAQQVLTNMDELKSLDRAKSEFLSIASHELRTPLTSIKGSLSLLNQGVAGDINENAKNLLSVAEGETDRLIRLINDLLDLAKIEARKFPLEKSWIPLNDLVADTIVGLKGLSEKAGVKVVHDFDVELSVNVDRDRIQQVLTNLLSNAIKYSPENGIVTIKTSIDGSQHLYIEVIDQGKGIAPEDQALIFEQFRQVTSEASPLVKGTGLGLAIARALVEEHGGEIGVQSTQNKGSTFYFTLVDWKLISNQETPPDVHEVAS